MKTETQTASSRDFYTGGTYASLHPGWHAEDSQWKANHILTAIKRSAIEANTIAEIGCGAGAILSALSRDFTTGSGNSGYRQLCALP